MYTRSQLEADRADAAFKADLAVNDQLLRQCTRDNSTWVQIYQGGDPERMARAMEARGFSTTRTHGGIGLRVHLR